ncbi:unnamed protein product [Paramecium pentaurelia]|uniref:Cilia- and flagella-associated protein 53 n=1 Tax=Paramecium pentaurelia TaxID=43138 RepID=A0A8S1TFF7_9CILI|nr:unnamed protein product [Paramecium pentaurelia]
MIQSSTRNRSEQLIYQRRQQEQYVGKLNTKLRQEHYERTFAAWENKGKDVANIQYTKNRLQQIRAEAEANKNQRREKLAFLLNEEHEQYQQEIKAMVETPEQVKERMMKEVADLKERKEVERAKQAEAAYNRRFRENADELRMVTQQFNELQAVAYRNMQMMEKQKMLEDQYEEEMIYAELYRREILKKERLEKEKELEQKAKVDERNKVLAVQTKMNEVKHQKTKEEIEQEKQMLKEEWKREDERHKQRENQFMNYKKEINSEIALNNEQQKEYKKQLKHQEKIEDKEMISQVLAREEAIAKMEQAEKQRQKEETRQFLLNFKNRTNEYSVNDQLKEKLINEENNRQWETKEAKWKAEDDARVKLMYEVYAQRADNVEIKKKLIEDEKNIKQMDKLELQRQMELYQKELEEKQRLEQEKIMQTKHNLINQMDEKKQRQQLLRDKKQQEEEALRKQKEEYDKKIELEKAKGRALLDELRKQRPY